MDIFGLLVILAIVLVSVALGYVVGGGRIEPHTRSGRTGRPWYLSGFLLLLASWWRILPLLALVLLAGRSEAGVSTNVLIVGGGGVGGTDYGGGAGGDAIVATPSLTSGNSYSVTVGSGGTGAGGSSGGNGGNSVFNGVTAKGGGAGGSYYGVAQTGGPGGGGGNGDGSGSTTGATGTSPGLNGGNGYAGAQGGGGGSDANAGGSATSSVAGAGAAGVQWTIDLNYYGGGGGGGTLSGTRGLGGSGGGGAGGSGNGTAGTANTGGGGGGAAGGGGTSGGAGGSGVVKIAWLTASYGNPGSGDTGTLSTVGSYTVDTFNSSGTFVAPGLAGSPTTTYSPTPIASPTYTPSITPCTTYAPACDSSTIHLWTLNATAVDACGIGSLTASSTPAYVLYPTAPGPGAYWAGPFTTFNFQDNNPFDVPLGIGSIEFSFQATDNSTNQYILSTNGPGVATRWLEFQIYGGALVVQTEGGNNMGSVAISTGVTYYCLANWDGAGGNFWMGTSLAGETQKFSWSTVLPTSAQVTQLMIGASSYSGGAAPFTGYIGNVRLSNSNRSGGTGMPACQYSPTPAWTATATPTPIPYNCGGCLGQYFTTSNLALDNSGNANNLGLINSPAVSTSPCLFVGGAEYQGPFYSGTNYPYAYVGYGQSWISQWSNLTSFAVGGYFEVQAIPGEMCLVSWDVENSEETNGLYINQVGGQGLLEAWTGHNTTSPNITSTTAGTVAVGECLYAGITSDGVNTYVYLIPGGSSSSTPVLTISGAVGTNTTIDDLDWGKSCSSAHWGFDGLVGYENDWTMYTSHRSIAPFD